MRVVWKAAILGGLRGGGVDQRTHQLHDIAHGAGALDLIVGHLDRELLLDDDGDLDEVEAIGAEVLDEPGIVDDARCVVPKVVGEQRANTVLYRCVGRQAFRDSIVGQGWLHRWGGDGVSLPIGENTVKAFLANWRNLLAA